jgi:hypothetical protein
MFFGFVSVSFNLLHVFICIQHGIQPPTLIALVLPHIPPPFPSIITSTLKYFRIGGVFLDDLAVLLFGVGFIVMVARWMGS